MTCAFHLGSHTFPEKNTTGIVFCIGHSLLLVLVCDNAISQTVPETLCTHSSAANRFRSVVCHRRFHYDWCMLSDVGRTHSFSWTMCGAIARLKQKYPILNRHAKSKFATIFNWRNKQKYPILNRHAWSKFATIFNWTNKQKYPILNRHARSKFAAIFNWTNSVHRKNIHQISQQLQLNIW